MTSEFFDLCYITRGKNIDKYYYLRRLAKHNSSKIYCKLLGNGTFPDIDTLL